MNRFEQIREGRALVLVPKEKKVSKKLPVFYNPAMKLNRDVSVLLLNSIKKSSMNIALPMAGTGVRGIRFLLELEKGKIGSISFNDQSPAAADIIGRNIRLNKIKNAGKASITSKDACIFLLESSGFDYIDIDPFGSPNSFLDSAVKRISRGGILAVTATDTSALAGSFPSACRRKYWAEPLKNECMHETGIRILIRKVQLVAAQFEKALTPVFSYSDLHYMRVFFSCEKGKAKADMIIRQHGMLGSAGPLWLGRLWDEKLASKISGKSSERMLKVIAEESKVNSAGFYDVHRICKKHKIGCIPKMGYVLEMAARKKSRSSLTHFSPSGIRSGLGKDEIESIIKSYKKHAKNKCREQKS